MSEVRVNNLSNENSSGGPTISGITTFSSTNYFVPPVGDTASRPQSCPPGSLRFNTDTAHLEYFRGDTIGWTEIEAELTEPLGDRATGNSASGTGVRALYAGGATPSTINTVDYFTIATLGDATDFGDLPEVKQNAGGASSRVFGLLAGGWNGAAADMIQKITIASKGNTAIVDSGLNTSSSKNACGGLSNGTRALFVGGATPSVNNVIDAVDILTTGVKFDFGDLTLAKYYLQGCSSTTRGIVAGGVLDSPYPNTNAIDYLTIASEGNARDFGDLTSTRGRGASLSNPVRAVFGGSYTVTTTIDYATIATTGNAVDFGDLTVQRACTGASSPTRGLFLGGVPGSNVVDYIEIPTTGNATDFGNLTTGTSDGTGISNGHGGLG